MLLGFSRMLLGFSRMLFRMLVRDFRGVYSGSYGILRARRGEEEAKREGLSEQ